MLWKKDVWPEHGGGRLPSLGAAGPGDLDGLDRRLGRLPLHPEQEQRRWRGHFGRVSQNF